MTPTEFEILTQQLLAKRLREQLGRDIQVAHQRDFTSRSGNTYNIDVSFTFELMGFHYLNIVECKHWNSYVPRSVVATLHSIVEDLKANKGIVVSARGFQSGAISYAQSKNIGLFKITNGEIGDILSHFDGGMARLHKQMLEDSEFYPNGNYEGVGLFFPKNDPLRFIEANYGSELAHFLKYEYSPGMLDESPLRISPVVRKQIRQIPEQWHKNYDLLETAGLGYKLANEPEMRVLCSVIRMLKMCL